MVTCTTASKQPIDHLLNNSWCLQVEQPHEQDTSESEVASTVTTPRAQPQGVMPEQVTASALQRVWRQVYRILYFVLHVHPIHLILLCIKSGLNKACSPIWRPERLLPVMSIVLCSGQAVTCALPLQVEQSHGKDIAASEAASPSSVRNSQPNKVIASNTHHFHQANSRARVECSDCNFRSNLRLK